MMRTAREYCPRSDSRPKADSTAAKFSGGICARHSCVTTEIRKSEAFRTASAAPAAVAFATVRLRFEPLPAPTRPWSDDDFINQ